MRVPLLRTRFARVRSRPVSVPFVARKLDAGRIAFRGVRRSWPKTARNISRERSTDSLKLGMDSVIAISIASLNRIRSCISV